MHTNKKYTVCFKCTLRDVNFHENQYKKYLKDHIIICTRHCECGILREASCQSVHSLFWNVKVNSFKIVQEPVKMIKKSNLIFPSDENINLEIAI